MFLYNRRIQTLTMRILGRAFLSKNEYNELQRWHTPPPHFALHLIPMETWVILPHYLHNKDTLWALVTSNSLVLSHFTTDLPGYTRIEPPH